VYYYWIILLLKWDLYSFIYGNTQHYYLISFPDLCETVHDSTGTVGTTIIIDILEAHKVRRLDPIYVVGQGKLCVCICVEE
jgi:hypothetical protein